MNPQNPYHLPRELRRQQARREKKRAKGKGGAVGTGGETAMTPQQALQLSKERRGACAMLALLGLMGATCASFFTCTNWGSVSNANNAPPPTNLPPPPPRPLEDNYPPPRPLENATTNSPTPNR